MAIKPNDARALDYTDKAEFFIELMKHLVETACQNLDILNGKKNILIHTKVADLSCTAPSTITTTSEKPATPTKATSNAQSQLFF